ncbi:MAG: phage replication initiation protein, NGO0469 family [Aeromonas sp.]
MALQAKRVKFTGGKPKLQSPLLDADNYPARLVQVIDRGLQKNFFDAEKVNHEVMLTYELDGVFCLDENGNDVLDKPRWFSETINMIELPEGMDLLEIYNDQFRGKAKMVTRSRAFDPKGVKEFDFSEMLDSPCAVTIIQKKKKDGEMKNEVGNVTAPMRGMQVAPLVNKPKLFALDNPDMEVFGSLPQWLQDDIKNNLEFKGSKLEALLNGKPTPKEPVAKLPDEPVPAAGGDDDVPW